MKQRNRGMDNQLKFKEFKKEFDDEISEMTVDVELLRKMKVSSSILEAEVFLRKIFGDEIYIPKKKEEKLTGEKEIVKLTEEDMAFDTQVREMCENVADIEFDNNVGLLMARISGEYSE